MTGNDKVIASIMTTTRAYYLVAYPHPSITPHERVHRFKVDVESDGKTILGKLWDVYSGHSDDLKKASLRKINRSSMT